MQIYLLKENKFPYQCILNVNRCDSELNSTCHCLTLYYRSYYQHNYSNANASPRSIISGSFIVRTTVYDHIIIESLSTNTQRVHIHSDNFIFQECPVIFNSSAGCRQLEIARCEKSTPEFYPRALLVWHYRIMRMSWKLKRNRMIRTKPCVTFRNTSAVLKCL